MYTPNISVQDINRFTKAFKTFTNFVWIEVFCVKNENTIIKINIWIAFKIEKIISHCIMIIVQLCNCFWCITFLVLNFP